MRAVETPRRFFANSKPRGSKAHMPGRRDTPDVCAVPSGSLCGARRVSTRYIFLSAHTESRDETSSAGVIPCIIWKEPKSAQIFEGHQKWPRAIKWHEFSELFGVYPQGLVSIYSSPFRPVFWSLFSIASRCKYAFTSSSLRPRPCSTRASLRRIAARVRCASAR